MKSKSFIVALLTVSTLGLTTSCADMFDVESTRVVYEKDHNLDNTSDSAYTTLGVLQGMRQIADRYVILGEVRGDMCEINENTKASLRNLANFNYEADNEYLDAKDYFAIINNCSYALAKMDTTLTINNSRVMYDEYAALLGIRAWTYLQLAINYGEVPYYDYKELVTTMEDFENVGTRRLKVEQLALELIPELLKFVDQEMPSFVSSIPQNVYPILRLVIADLCLWSGDYLNACLFYDDYLLNNRKFTSTLSTGSINFNRILMPSRLMKWNGKTGDKSMVTKPFGELYSSSLVSGSGYENLAYITMETAEKNGITSELASLFYSFDNTHLLNPSTAWKELSASQVVFSAEKDGNGDLKKLTASTTIGDMRASKELYLESATDSKENEYDTYSKFGYATTSKINIYRRSIVYLRYAEALNSLAYQLKTSAADSLARVCAHRAFYILKDASKAVTFNVDSATWVRNKNAVQSEFVGIHARGAGDVAYDTTHYVLKPAVIAERLGKGSGAPVSFNDTIQYIDELIIDELALESTLEGNRFGDLVRFALRRQVWAQNDPEGVFNDDYRDFLARRVADRSGVRDEALYEKLHASEEYWYLPLK